MASRLPRSSRAPVTPPVAPDSPAPVTPDSTAPVTPTALIEAAEEARRHSFEQELTLEERFVDLELGVLHHMETLSLRIERLEQRLTMLHEFMSQLRDIMRRLVEPFGNLIRALHGDFDRYP